MPRCAEMVRQAIEYLPSAVAAADDEHPSGVEAAELARAVYEAVRYDEVVLVELGITAR